MKKRLKHYVMIVFAITIFFGSMIVECSADAKSYNLMDNYQGGSCSAVISGNKLYFSITETGSIFCYNIKTKKTSTLVHKNGKGFYHLKKKDNYLYAVYDSYLGSDGSNDSIVRISIKNGKVTKLAKGSNYILQKNKIYYTKTKRVTDKYDYAYDKPIGVYSMSLSGKKQKRASKVKLVNNESKQIVTSKGTLYTTGETYGDDYYSPEALYFKNKKGKTITIYDADKDKKAPKYASIDYYTIQGNYIVYKKHVEDSKYGSLGQLVLVKTNGKDKRVFYSRASVSGW